MAARRRPGAPLAAHFFATLREANAFIVADEPDNVPGGEDPKFDSLEQRIAAARKTEDERVSKEHHTVNVVRGRAIQVASTMVGYPLGGIIVGFMLDKVFGTMPWITIVLMFLAFIGAIVNVVRIGKNADDNRAG